MTLQLEDERAPGEPPASRAPRRGLRAAAASGVRFVPRAAWLCALVAVINGIAWSLLIPPLQSFDETVHIYYGQFMGETGSVPKPIAGSVLSDEEYRIVYLVRLFDVVGNVDGRPPWTRIEDQRLDRDLASGKLGRVSQGADGGVGSYPPLYYGLGAIAYRLTPSSSLLDRMAAMRLVSALLAGVAVLFTYLFLRELLPRERWAWTIGALVAALQPLFGFMSGVFNPDMGLIAGTSAVLFCLARAFRHGLSPQLAVGLGVATAAGFLAKLSMLGLLPGIALGVILLARRARSWRPLFAAAAGAGVPVFLYSVVNVAIWNRPVMPSATGGAPPVGRNFKEMLGYIWQDYLPRLPFMNDIPADYPLWSRYFRSLVGIFGWGDYGFPLWVSQVALALLAVALAAAIALALRHRAAFAARWAEWLTYAAMTAGLLALLGYTGYGYWRDTDGNGFEQGRYLLPLLGLYAGLVTAAVRGLGRRAGPIAGSLLVILAVAHSVWAQLLTLARFYG